ncbi:MAG: hypothetical protein JNL43_10725 [Flavobacteriales bacterium]|nr:hypothetical protein [Flavobacteriales bacterium]
MKDDVESTATADRVAHDRWSIAVGWSVLAVLGMFAWTYFLERTACFDSAFFSWSMIDGKEPFSVLGRYGSWLPQLLPVALVRSGASLDSVLRVYSVSFIVFHGVVFGLLAFGLKDRRAAIALPIVLTAGFHYMFYYGISELYQGLSLTILLWAMIRRLLGTVGRRALWIWAIAIVLLNTWISLYHQLLVLPVVFILVLESIPGGALRRKRLFLVGLVLVVWYIVRIKTFPTSTYEAERMVTKDDILSGMRQLGQLNSTVYFLSIWTKFKAFLLLAVLTVGLAIRERAWVALLWTFLFSCGFMVLILIVDRDSVSPIICENYYPVVGLFWAVLFVSLLGEGGRTWAVLRTGALGFICVLGLLQIHRAHYRISEKVHYAQRLTNFWTAYGSRKSIVHFNSFPWAYALGHWPLGMESALASSVKGQQYAATLFASDDVGMIDKESVQGEQFLGPSWNPVWFKIPALNLRYFDLPMDTGYTHANTWVPDFHFDQLRLSGPRTPFRMFPDRFTVVPIVIHNPTDLRMPSITADGVPFRFSYTLFRMDGTVYQESSELSSLETDIPSGATYYQGLVVERPVDPGRYVVQARMLAGSVPVGASLRFEVEADRWPF